MPDSLSLLTYNTCCIESSSVRRGEWWQNTDLFKHQRGAIYSSFELSCFYFGTCAPIDSRIWSFPLIVRLIMRKLYTSSKWSDFFLPLYMGRERYIYREWEKGRSRREIFYHHPHNVLAKLLIDKSDYFKL